MKFMRACLFAVAVLVMIRGIAYLIYVDEQINVPTEVCDLESKFVHLAWRVQAGVRLYPPWQDYPHVTNFFSPLYFVLVGLIGALTNASLQQLFVIGRTVTVACALATTAIVGWMLRRGDARWAVLFGGAATLGAAPMFGAALMVRPDTMAELCGVAGFILALGSRAQTRIAGLAILILAIFSKQTALLFLIASVAALVAAGRQRHAAVLLLTSAVSLAAIIAGISYFEPMFAISLIGEGKTAWVFSCWTTQIAEVALTAPDLFIVPVLGASIWLCERPRQTAPIALWLAVGGFALVTAAKFGSASNYFLTFRVVEGLALGAIWAATCAPQCRRGLRHSALLLITAASLIPGTILAVRYAWISRLDAQFYRSQEGHRLLLAKKKFFTLAANPRVKLLTDSGEIQLHQRERAPFVDPFQFRHMVNSGQIQPEVILKELREGSYDYVITTADLFDSAYEADQLGFPQVVTQTAREHYIPQGNRLGRYVHLPRSGRPRAPAPSRTRKAAPPRP